MTMTAMQAAEAKKEEHRTRGKADTRTSDPKFDARFKLGYQLADKGKEVCHTSETLTGPCCSIRPSLQV